MDLLKREICLLTLARLEFQFVHRVERRFLKPSLHFPADMIEEASECVTMCQNTSEVIIYANSQLLKNTDVLQNFTSYFILTLATKQRSQKIGSFLGV